MIDDEKKWIEQCDRRREERDRRLDEEWEYRDTAADSEKENEDD